MTEQGRRWVLAERPTGSVAECNFRLESFAVPHPAEGEIRVRVLLHTVAPGVLPKLVSTTYAAMVQIGQAIPGNGVGYVEESGHPEFAPGDLVAGELSWSTHAVTDPQSIKKLDATLFGDDLPIDYAIGVLGNAGLSGYFGILKVGQVAPGQVVLISSASGAVGCVAGQVARNHGCKVIGIAGSAEKCARLVDRFGFDAAINYRLESDLAAAIKRAAPNGIEVYFDTVGGEVTEAAILNMKLFGRVVVCGQTSEYQRTVPHGLRQMTQVISRRLTLQGFVVHDFATEFDAGRRELAAAIRAGKLLHNFTIVDGIEHAAENFVRQFDGGGGGQALIRVGELHRADPRRAEFQIRSTQEAARR